MSAFYPDLQAVFVHIPKCGGTYIENVLSKITTQLEPEKTNSVGRHATFFQILNKADKVFSQVREPVSWYLSYYRFCKYKQIFLWEPNVWHPTDILANCDWSDFNKWVFSVQKLRPSFLTRMYESFVGDERMKTNIQIFRLEDQPNATLKIFEYLNISANVPKLDRTEYNESVFEIPAIHNDTVALIKEREKNIYERFHYDYP